ncbi:MAG: hypothetical protein OQK82_07540 [Candidatus Pacearchaeota archaeon]|nr:hypothetical protein [Candidatus Pacearchaeota archaeon]
MLNFFANRNWLGNQFSKTVVLTCCALIIAGCVTTYGTVHVGQPQVHTRDRLVAERYDEAAWLHTKLKPKNLENVGDQVDGYRDLRAFTGLFASISATADPAGSTKKQLDTKTVEAEAEAAYWKAKARAEAAKEAYETPPQDEEPQEQEIEPAVHASTTTTTTDVTTTEFLHKADGTLFTDGNNNPVVVKKTVVNESPSLAQDDTDQPEIDDEAVASAAKAAAEEAVAEAKKTADDALSKAKAAEKKLDDAIKATTESRFADKSLGSAETSKWKVKPSPLNKLHDQMAYRDVVNAALRRVELDDSHDLAGGQLYELTLDTTVVPGKHSTQYAQLELLLEPLSKDEATRRKQMPALFHRWVNFLQSTLHEETYTLLNRNKVKELTSSDEEFINWFLFSHAPVVKIELQNRSRALGSIDSTKGIEAQASNITSAKTAGDFLPLAFRLSEKTLPSDGKSIASETLSNKLNNAILIVDSIISADKGKEGSVKRKQARKQAIPFAVWVKYRNELSDIVEITPPVIGANGMITGGFEVKPVPGVIIAEPKPGNEVVTPEDIENAESLCPSVVATPRSEELIKDDLWFRETGICAFTQRIINAENHPVAISVSPKESGQNVSEMAARESMLELLLNLTAVTKSQNTSGTVNTQFLKSRKEQAHALTRKPQVIGFGQGRERFGWLLGPRYRITQSGKPEWLHEAVRHDVSAAIVVPGWWRFMHVSGIYSWIDDDGKTIHRACVWGGELKEVNGRYKCQKVDNKPKPYVSLNLPMSAEPMAEITRALISPAGANNRYSVFADRTPPAIEDVVTGNNVHNVTAGGIVNLLIHGKDLWRSPQVFLGSVEATSVKVLSDMNALLATFDTLPYPGTEKQKNAKVAVTQTVTVLTAFGHDQYETVSVLPSFKVTKPAPVIKPSASLSTKIHHGKDPKIVFNIPNAEQTAGIFKLRIRNKGQKNWSDPVAGKVKLELKGDEAIFILTKPADTKVVEVTVVRLANNATDMSNAEAMLKKPATLALFKDENLTKGTISAPELTFEKDGSYSPSSNKLVVRFEQTNSDKNLFNVLSAAYPGWGASFPDKDTGKAQVSFYNALTDEAVIVLAAECKKKPFANKLVAECVVTADAIGKAFKDKVSILQGHSYNVLLVFDGEKGGEISVDKKVKITQKKS